MALAGLRLCGMVHHLKATVQSKVVKFQCEASPCRPCVMENWFKLPETSEDLRLTYLKVVQLY